MEAPSSFIYLFFFLPVRIPRNAMASWFRIYLNPICYVLVGSLQPRLSHCHFGMSSALLRYCLWSSPYETSCYKIQPVFIKSDKKNSSLHCSELLQETMILRENKDNFQSVANWISKNNKINEEVKTQEHKDKSPPPPPPIFFFLSYNGFLYCLGITDIIANKTFSVCFSFI